MQVANLTLDECHCGLLNFYRNVAKKLGYEDTDRITFDCTKICVTKHVQDEMRAFYKYIENHSDESISMLLCCSGPKANYVSVKSVYAAEVEDGFISFIS